MYLAERIRQLREAKNLSQGDIEDRTGLLRCYVSRVENGHTVPALETLEKIARALETPLYQLFYEEEELRTAELTERNPKGDWASHGKGYRTFRKFQMVLSRMSEKDRELLLQMAGTAVRVKRTSVGTRH
jgi:transcriptional regulator with XRE-family HTH domain